MQGPPEGVTSLLRQWAAGDDSARDRAIGLVHAELIQLAARYLRGEREGHTLQPTALVNEAYLRMTSLVDRDWQNRAQFFAMAAHLMRQVLVDHARQHRAQKRGGGLASIQLDESIATPGSDARGLNLLDLHDALTELEKASPRASRILELQAFGGLSIEEIMAAMELSQSTVARELRLGKAWIYDFIHQRS